MTNRLAQESSPYLKQHEHNPVDWYPWGEEALARSRRENKPILLSIGYSACHWCHVMAHECFENPEIAAVMNEHFINIKVDREERPDLDQIYQNVAQIMTQGGGWPLTVFLTPGLRPFFGGTYFPPVDKYGRPGFPRVLVSLSEAFKNDPANVEQNADKLTEMIAGLEKIDPAELQAGVDLSAIKDQLLSHIDWQEGGIGSAPKFPNTMTFSFLWRTGDAEARRAVLLTLTKMARGGIYDQLGGAFSRYSVDAEWSVPHFEKMLYDNALLLKLYSEVLLTGELTEDQRELFFAVVSDTVGWVLREMTSPEGLFYAAQDADSEGEEGKFFAWTPRELKAHLTVEEAQAFAFRYGVTEGGNFEHQTTVLFQCHTVQEVSQQLGVDKLRAEKLLESAREKLFLVRKKRIAPGLDDKCLTAWNGLMISGLLWAGQALKASQCIQEGETAILAARRAYEFLLKSVSEGSRLKSVFKGGTARLNAYLDDYAFMSQAALDLARFSVSTPERFIKDSQNWIAQVLTHFRDPAGLGYFFTSDDHEKLIQRPKTIYDQAIPSGTGIVLGCLTALSEMDGGEKYSAELQEQLKGLFPVVQKNPYGYGELLCVKLLNERGPVTVSGSKASEVCVHPHIFQKGGTVSGLLVCHRQTCSLPIVLVSEARKEALKKVL